jgi:enoyl-CoA hydratase/carnithine racemase
MTDQNVVLSELKDGVLTLTLNRPKKLNAMSHEVFAALGAAVSAASDDRTVRVVIVTGAGTTFSAGADLDMVREFSSLELAPETFRATLRNMQSVFDRLEQLEKPVIAAINGACVGGGVDLVLACDLRIAVTDAFIMIPEVRLGIIPDLGATQRLPRLVGVGRAKDLILTGRRVRAEECLAMGLFNRVVPREQLAAALTEMATDLKAGAPLAVGLAKQAIDRAWATELRTGEELEGYLQAPLYRSDDVREGYAAFRERRDPKWTGR